MKLGAHVRELAILCKLNVIIIIMRISRDNNNIKW